MRIFTIDRLWKPGRLAKVVESVISLKNERREGLPSKYSRMRLAWKRTTNVLELRFQVTEPIAKGSAVQIVMSRNELFLMTSRWLGTLSEQQLITAIKAAGSLAESPTSPDDTDR